jgi:hypothetical protein
LKHEDGDFFSVMELFEFDLTRIDNQENVLKESFHKMAQKVQQIPASTASQIDLMKKLLTIDPGTITHHVKLNAVDCRRPPNIIGS